MADDKHERQRKRRAAARKKKTMERAARSVEERRQLKAFRLAHRAASRLDQGDATGAVVKAAEAARLDPRDPDIADLYLDAASTAGDGDHQVRALQHRAGIGPPDSKLFARLAYALLVSGDLEAAGTAAAHAREALPARKKDRKVWLQLIQHVEDVVEKHGRFPDPPGAGRGRRGRAPGAKGRASTSGNPPETKPVPRPQWAPEETRDPTAAGSAVAESDATSDAKSTSGARKEEAPASPPDRTPASRPPPIRIAVEVAGDIDGLEMLATDRFSTSGDVRLATLASRLRDADSYQRLFSLERASDLLPFPHQEDTVRKVLAEFLGRALLADEVGLGKTIEAGLILTEYLLRGQVERALVLVPPSLVEQWVEELETKFDVRVRSTEDPGFRSDPEEFWRGPGVVVASLATARSPKQREVVTEAPWDLLIVDEAHALKRANTASHELVARISSRFLLLLTATPIESEIDEIYNLVSLIRPGHLGGRAEFRRRFSDTKLRRSEETRAKVRALLAQIMVRNTRALSGVSLPPRFARTVLVPPDPGEGELYEHLAAALRSLGPGGRTRLLLSLLLQEAGSSPFAVRSTLERIRANRDHPPEVARALEPALQCSARTASTGKTAALLRVVEEQEGPFLVFTRFRGTLDFLATQLKRAGVRFETMDGGVRPALRHEAAARVAKDGGVLLSTEVGSEGLNLQFCRCLVNFDLPWNPMRIEQRIGRLHRIGQDHAVDVVNFCLAGSIEERILTILDERINLFELVVGEVEMILGYLDDERGFSDLMLEAFADPDDEERERSFSRIGDSLQAARDRYDNVKRFDEEFFRGELGA